MEKYSSRFELKPGRFVYIPTTECLEVGRQVVREVCDYWAPPPWFFHFAKGGHLAAVDNHSGHQVLSRQDFSNFYGAVTHSKLVRTLKRVGMPYSRANEIARLSTVRQDSGYALPYGFVQSPFLASLALDQSYIGRTIRDLPRLGISRSVYMDDMIVSHATEHGPVDEAIKLLKSSAQISSFPLNEEKSQGPANQIEVFNIDISAELLSIAPDRLLEFRSNIIEFGPGLASDAIIRYVDGINAGQADLLRDELG